jgi:DNA topoisomerase-1
VCASCNKEVDELIDNIKYETKMEYPIDDDHTYIIGKYGPVIKCVTKKEIVKGKKGTKESKEITFKSAKKNLDMEKLKNGEYELKDVIEMEEILDKNIKKKDEKNIKETDDKNIKNEISNKQNVLGQYEGKDIILHKGKFGLYALCGDKTNNLKELGNRPIENITLEEVAQILDKGPTMIREINSFLSIRKGPKGDYLFYKNSKMKKPSFHDIKSFSIETKEDYKICELTILKSWITTKYNIKN